MLQSITQALPRYSNLFGEEVAGLVRAEATVKRPEAHTAIVDVLGFAPSEFVIGHARSCKSEKCNLEMSLAQEKFFGRV